jgi:hypothetical protein
MLLPDIPSQWMIENIALLPACLFILYRKLVFYLINTHVVDIVLSHIQLAR